MYIPKQYEEKDVSEIKALIAEFGFATLVSTKDGKPWATHLPLELETAADGTWVLQGHIARANPQWRNFEEGKEVLAIFMGPHTYVSPSWYDAPNVPTWNYMAAHVYGAVEILTGEDLKNMLRELMARYENAHAEQPFHFDDMPDDLLQKDLNGLVGFKIKVTRIEAASKLSQNRNEKSYDNIIAHLKTMGAYDAERIAKEMDKRKENL